MRVLLTGGSGFVGSHVTRLLVKEGHDVALILRNPRSARRLDDVIDRTRVIEGSLENLDDTAEAFADFRPQAILHFAWAGVGGRFRNDLFQIANIDQSVRLMRMGIDLGVDYFLGMGSQAEYGQAQARVSEDHATQPTTLYGAAKLTTGKCLADVADMASCGFAWLRLFSSYGPDDDDAWMLSYVIDELLRGGTPSLTKCEQLWDYIHVYDVAGAVLAALTHGAQGTFNLGFGAATPLRDVVTFVRDTIDPDLELGFGLIPYRNDQVMHLEADITQLRKAASWSPEIDLETGLRNAVEGRRALMKTNEPRNNRAN